MKPAALICLAFGLTACSQTDQQRANEEAHQTAEQLKHDSKVALDKAEVETRKASRELDSDLAKAREKTRRALNEPDTPTDTTRR